MIDSGTRRGDGGSLGKALSNRLNETGDYNCGVPVIELLMCVVMKVADRPSASSSSFMLPPAIILEVVFWFSHFSFPLF